MPNLYTKILFTSKKIVSPKELLSTVEALELGQKLNFKIKKLFHGSLAIREVDTGSTNACEQELNALTNSFYDIERFGIHFVASPRHADMLIVTGPVTRNMREALIKTYNATPDPKIVVALGDDATLGGIFKGTYATLDGVDQVIPVHFYIAGDPPTPSGILRSLLEILEIIDRDTIDIKKK